MRPLSGVGGVAVRVNYVRGARSLTKQHVTSSTNIIGLRASSLRSGRGRELVRPLSGVGGVAVRVNYVCGARSLARTGASLG